MRRIADLHPGEAKTDARDDYIIAEAARSMPHTLRSIAVADEQAAELSMHCGVDDDLAKQAKVASNRIRGLLTQIHPALERIIGPHLDHPVMAELLQNIPRLRRCAGLARAGSPRSWPGPLRGPEKAGPRGPFTALSEQTVRVAGTGAAGVVLPQLAAQLSQLRASRAEILAQGVNGTTRP